MKDIDYLNKFIKDFFSENHCEVREEDKGVFRIQLTEDLDKQLMNRPFYWHYVESTNQRGQPLEIKLITDINKRDRGGEWLHLGSPIFKQILSHLKTNTRFTKLYEHVDLKGQIPLYPWLLVNIKLIYKGILSKEELFSIGLNLINGEMLTGMMDRLENKSFHETISDYCYSLSPIITMQSGFNRIIKVFDQYIEKQSHHWAHYSLKKLQKERELIDSYFGNSTSNEGKNRILKETEDRYMPELVLEVVNGGVFYLKDS